MKKTMLFAALLVSMTAVAQERAWTLSDCIDYALEHNLSVQQSGINVEQQEIALNTAESNRLPGLSGSAGQNFSFGRGLTADNTYANTNTTSTSFSLGSDLTIFNGGRVRNNIELSKLDLEAATADLAKAKDDISVAVAQAYVQILYNQEIVEVAENQVSIDEAQVSRLKEMASNGKASRAEVSAQEATLAQSRVSLTQARNSLSLSILDLTQLLELPSPEGFSVVRPSAENLTSGLLMSPEAIYEEAVGVKPVIKSEEIRLDHALKNIDLAKGAFLPSVSMSAGLGTNFYTSSGYESNPFFTQLKNNFSQYIGVNLNVPIFSRYSNRNQLKSANLALRNQEIQLENTKKQLFKEIQQAYYNAVAAQEKFASCETAARSAKDAFDLAQAKYEGGKAGITEYNEAKGRYVSAESNLVQARYENLYQSKLLDFYRGQELMF